MWILTTYCHSSDVREGKQLFVIGYKNGGSDHSKGLLRRKSYHIELDSRGHQMFELHELCSQQRNIWLQVFCSYYVICKRCMIENCCKSNRENL
ncbi:hypothetical protein MPTK1_2g10390 [Marchantia polymorpha subsp. ruderalis]|nr:hypothetical protein Mp_2g10390 [Marchantia polymorpha subsp. ruderalis]